jgi:hypothetical protein
MSSNITSNISKLSSFDIVKRRRNSKKLPQKVGRDGKKLKKLASFDTVKQRKSGTAEIFTLGTDLHIIVDRSGSMQSMGDTPANQIRQLLEDQKKIAQETGKKIVVTLTTFDDKAENVLENIDISDYDIPDIAYFKDILKPRGCTRFYDTVIEAIANQKARVKSWPMANSVRKLKPVIGRALYVLTDGYDNSSHMSVGQLRSCMKTNQQLAGFNAIFLAANIGNAQEVGASMGFNPDTSLTIDAGRQRSANGMMAAASLLRAISSGSSAPPMFSAMQRQSSAPITQPYTPLPSVADDPDDFSDDDDQSTLHGTPFPTLTRQTNNCIPPPPPLNYTSLRQPVGVPLMRS